MKRIARITMAVAAVLALLLVTLVTGCGQDNTSTETPNVTGAPGTDATSLPATTEKRPSTTIVQEPLTDRIEYARSLGGVSRQGATLFFVVGTETTTEAEAQALLQKAIPSFGDMQSYFIVQESDNFDGMVPGRWVIIEAYETNPSSENREFGQRAFPDAYVVQAKVLTTEPIPVYEDRLGL